MESVIHRVNNFGLEKECILLGWDEAHLLGDTKNKIHPPTSLG